VKDVRKNVKNARKTVRPGFVLFAVLMISASCVSLKSGGRFKPGIYYGTAQGYYGPVGVEVEVDGSSIIDIKVLEEDEDPMIGGEAIKELRRLMLEEDTTDLDAVSGATISSDAFIAAVNNALSKQR